MKSVLAGPFPSSEIAEDIVSFSFEGPGGFIAPG